MRSLGRLLRPRSIAVFGGRAAEAVIRENDKLGFEGPIWPVHPTRESMAGRCVFRSVADLPQAPDAAFLAVNRQATVQVVRDLAASGGGGAVCYAAGFAEADAEGGTLQAILREAAGCMPLLGPNCYGTLNYLDGAALWPDQHGGERVGRGVAIITQSGNIGLNLTMQRRGLSIAYLATLGNQAVVGLSAMLAALAEDPRITAVGLHLEAIDDAAEFVRAVNVARGRGMSVVAIKTGASPAGAALTLSHTASMSGPDAVIDAFLRRAGVARVHTLPALIETLKILHVHGPLPSAEIVSMSCSGGEAALLADRAASHGVQFRPFTPEQQGCVRATVHPLVTVSNPLDYHTFHWADREALAATFTAVMDARFALTLLVLDYPRSDRASDADWQIAAAALSDAAAATGQRAAIVASLPECLSEERAADLITRGIVPLFGFEEALIACAAAVVRQSCAMLYNPPPHGVAKTLDEFDSKRLLAASGVPVPPGMRARTAAEACAPAYPAAVKVLGIAHKTDCAALRLDLPNAAAVADAARALHDKGGALLVEAMVPKGVAELIIGVARDALGPYLLVGSGGILAELVGDRCILMMPASESDLAAAIGSLKVGRLLAGYRGRPPADMPAALAAILAIQRWAIANLDRLVELEVNPLIVTPVAAVAADALIRLVEPAHD